MKSHSRFSNVHEAKSQLSNLIERAERGEDVVISRAGVPVVRLVAIKQETTPRKPGIWKNKVKISKDFDDLPTEIMKAFRGSEE